MSNVIPHIYKDKLPKDMVYLLKYTDVEVCFLGCSAVDVCLELSFCNTQNYWQADRERSKEEGNYKLITVSYHPGEEKWKNEAESGAIIFVNIYAVPQDVAKISGLNRVMLGKIIAEQIKKIMPNSLPGNRCLFKLTLLSKQVMLKCVCQIWDGIRAQPENILMVSLN